MNQHFINKIQELHTRNQGKTIWWLNITTVFTIYHIILTFQFNKTISFYSIPLPKKRKKNKKMMNKIQRLFLFGIKCRYKVPVNWRYIFVKNKNKKIFKSFPFIVKLQSQQGIDSSNSVQNDKSQKRKLLKSQKNKNL